jgi:hypothetical protein
MFETLEGRQMFSAAQAVGPITIPLPGTEQAATVPACKSVSTGKRLSFPLTTGDTDDSDAAGTAGR